jgi:uncharacterized protein (TIGR02117 family)
VGNQQSGADAAGSQALLTRGARVWRLLALLMLTAAGCLTPAAVPPPPVPDETRSVYVVRHGWHTRLAVRLADIDPALWPESRALGDVAHIDVGWGDRDFYQADRPTVWQGFRAAATPTRAVLHLGGFDTPVPELFAGQDIVRVDVSPPGLDRLARYVHDSYARDAAGRTIRTGHGRYPISAFYEATGTYHLLSNSNHWTARALQQAGVPVTPAYAITAGSVIRQARRAGTPIP